MTIKIIWLGGEDHSIHVIKSEKNLTTFPWLDLGYCVWSLLRSVLHFFNLNKKNMLTIQRLFWSFELKKACVRLFYNLFAPIPRWINRVIEIRITIFQKWYKLSWKTWKSLPAKILVSICNNQKIKIQTA